MPENHNGLCKNIRIIGTNKSKMVICPLFIFEVKRHKPVLFGVDNLKNGLSIFLLDMIIWRTCAHYILVIDLYPKI